MRACRRKTPVGGFSVAAHDAQNGKGASDMAKGEASQQAGPGVVEQLAEWVLGVRAEDISQAAVTQAKLLLLDTIGCGVAALNEESARAVLAVVETSGGAPQCTVIGGTQLTCA